MLKLFLGALALMLMFEGLMPLLFTNFWRNMMQNLSLQDPKTLRMIGFVCFILGAILWFIVGHSGLF